MILQRNLSNFILILLKKKIIVNKLRNFFLHFFNIAKWSKKTRTFKNAFNVRSTFFHVVYVIRLIVLKHVISNDFALTMSKTHILENYCQQYFRANISKFFEKMQFLRKKVKKIESSYYVHLIINWWSSRNELCYRDMSINLI